MELNLPIELLELTELRTQIRLTQVCTYFHNCLRIYDFDNIDTEYLEKITDEILKFYPFIKKIRCIL